MRETLYKRTGWCVVFLLPKSEVHFIMMYLKGGVKRRRLQPKDRSILPGEVREER